MVTFHDRRDETDYVLEATDDSGSSYRLHGADSKEAGHIFGHALASGAIPPNARLTKKGPLVHYPPNRG